MNARFRNRLRAGNTRGGDLISRYRRILASGFASGERMVKWIEANQPERDIPHERREWRKKWKKAAEAAIWDTLVWRIEHKREKRQARQLAAQSPD